MGQMILQFVFNRKLIAKDPGAIDILASAYYIINTEK